MEKVKLSVCIPVYNCEDYVKIAIDSILQQDFKDYELIIVDNQSTDRTVEIIKSYKDKRIKFYQNETNIGMVANWNKALTLVSGEYIKILPADDFLYPGTLRVQYEVLENDKEGRIALVCGRKRIINDKGKTLFTRGFSKSPKQVNGFEAINKTIQSGGNIIGEPGVVMFRKSILEKSGLFDASIYYVMDVCTWFKMLKFGDLYSLPDVICAFRISHASESTKIVDKQRHDVDAFIRKIYADSTYQLSTYSYRKGLFNSFLSATAKKIIYKLIIR
jgi:glycosyltransferase involved in cell wall biosynthesis